ncbi:MAG: response regulator [Acidobacteriaceae bacterium]
MQKGWKTPGGTAVKTVLVAEDNQVNRELVTEILTAAGYAVVEAVDGEDLLARLEEKLPDIVLVDLQMPKLDGLGALRKIRERAEWRSLPVIACTAFAMQDDREKALRAGFDGYLSKPITMSGLLAAIQISI